MDAVDRLEVKLGRARHNYLARRGGKMVTIHVQAMLANPSLSSVSTVDEETGFDSQHVSVTPRGGTRYTFVRDTEVGPQNRRPGPWRHLHSGKEISHPALNARLNEAVHSHESKLGLPTTGDSPVRAAADHSAVDQEIQKAHERHQASMTEWRQRMGQRGSTKAEWRRRLLGAGAYG